MVATGGWKPWSHQERVIKMHGNHRRVVTMHGNHRRVETMHGNHGGGNHRVTTKWWQPCMVTMAGWKPWSNHGRVETTKGW